MKLSIILETLRKDKEQNRLASKKVSNIYKKKRKGTNLTFNEILAYAKTIPFVHGTKFENVKNILKSRELISHKKLYGDEADVNTYPLDIFLGTNQNIFFSWGIPCGHCFNGVFFLYSYDVMKGQSAYAQMRDVIEIFGNLVDNGMFNSDVSSDDYSYVQPSELTPEDLNILNKKMQKARFSIKDFVRIQAYLMWRFAGKNRINNLEQLIRSFFAKKSESDYNEIHIRNQIDIRKASKAVYIGKSEVDISNFFLKVKKRYGINIVDSGKEYIKFTERTFLIDIFNE